MFFWIFKCYTLFCLTASLTAVSQAAVDFPVRDRSVSTAVQRASEYLWETMRVEHWNRLSPRVAVALSFAQRAGIRGQWESVLEKEVAIHAKMAVLKGNDSLSLFDLSQHVNALYATCQDPRRFHGLDLVRILRTRTDAARRIEPFVFLTLCLSGQIDRQDFHKLQSMYNNVREDTLGSKALIVMALVCLLNAQGYGTDNFPVFSDFKKSTDPNLNSYDIYSKILHVQALNAVQHRRANARWALDQLTDGSFGDALATYYAVPALLGASLLDLKCSTFNDVESPPLATLQDSRSNVVYSLWIEKEGYPDAHSMSLPLRGNATFLDLMKMARTKNAVFRFQCDVTSGGERVYSIGDIPNDVETSKGWTLYRGRKDRVKFGSKDYLARQNKGVDRIYPRPGDHFVFWYERSST